MTSQWARVNRVLEQALELPESERAEFVARECAGDDSLRAEVQSLLDHDRSAPAFMSAAFDAAPGVRLGAYQLLRRAGAGGMGDVWIAERSDQQFEQRVAIKLIRGGAMNPELVRRFVRERQILASLEHEGIARLFDGGAAPDGAPYVVMEYVEGAPIDAYCRDHHLPANRRLELFAQVCDAVQFAHQRLVVHRDIKPANILIMANGRPKLLDFGIAKVLGDSADDQLTHTGLSPLTPAYASPEQAGGGPITTASDVYSLGVVLYELLTGERPPRPDTPRAPGATPTPVQKPSESNAGWRSIRGDLRTIAQKALQPDVPQRYGAVAELAEDVRRYLDGRPILARPPSKWYRARKFTSRHRVPVGLLVLLLVALSSFSMLTYRQSKRIGVERDQAKVARDQAETARAQAETARGSAERTTDFLLSIFRSIEPKVARGRDTTLLEAILEDAETRLPAALPDPAVRASLLHTLGLSYAAMARYDSANRTFAQALELHRASGIAPTINHIDTLRELGTSQAELGDIAAARETLTLAERQAEQIEGRQSLMCAVVLESRGLLERLQYNTDESAKLLGEALEIKRAILPPDSPDLAAGYHNFALARYDAGEIDEAVELERRALAIERAQQPLDEPLLALRLSTLAAFLARDDRAAAVKLFDETLALQRRVYPAGHPDLAVTLENLATLTAAGDDPDRADAYSREAVAMSAAVYGPAHVECIRASLARVKLLVSLKRLDAAQSLLDQTQPRIPPSEEAAIHLAAADRLRGLLAVARKDFNQAIEWFDKARARYAAAVGEEHWAVSEVDALLTAARDAREKRGSASEVPPP